MFRTNSCGHGQRCGFSMEENGVKFFLPIPDWAGWLGWLGSWLGGWAVMDLTPGSKIARSMYGLVCHTNRNLEKP